MPTYEYKCNECFKNFDIVQSMKDNPLTNCPNCNSSKFLRIISVPMIITKTKTGIAEKIIDKQFANSIDGSSLNLHRPMGAFGVKFEKNDEQKRI